MKWLRGLTSSKITCAKNVGAPVTSEWMRVTSAAILLFSESRLLGEAGPPYGLRSLSATRLDAIFLPLAGRPGNGGSLIVGGSPTA
jgi:hypothetical protein